MKRRQPCRTFSVPKVGHQDNENEDRFRAPAGFRAGGNLVALAVSDGATEASFSREWADAMVETNWCLLTEVPTVSGTDILEPALIEPWVREARATFARHTDGRSLPWYARAKMSRQGAFATFLGLRLTQGGGRRRWTAVACGDTCLFHVVGEHVRVAFPVQSMSEFGNRPELVPSNSAFPLPPFRRREETWGSGDVFLLATDAVAMWLLDERDGETRLRQVLGCGGVEEFRTLIDQERAEHRIKNDDSTVLIVTT